MRPLSSLARAVCQSREVFGFSHLRKGAIGIKQVGTGLLFNILHAHGSPLEQKVTWLKMLVLKLRNSASLALW